ncbi:DNA gyrase inhibitor YacG [Wielerella bovis]|uniref:DNA gyrase inhibitor YacG n=1 Tax=Wielerella bovis TaxID=2917790 RepID=UPI00201854AF|nr:DNA gyrase inhibitor YacG [Wielerella bovis]MCG7656054.1 DNA gyrase inhibitor YacG [Wielerella bovis]MCG7658280.1 DNA gyrase inhibitor YacG [Wielerella bovis]
MINTVKCPTCQTSVLWQPENRYRPFCSERCKLIDLGEWVEEKRAIPTLPETPEEWDALHHE